MADYTASSSRSTSPPPPPPPPPSPPPPSRPSSTTPLLPNSLHGQQRPVRPAFSRTSTLKIERYVGQQPICISREMSPSPTLPEHDLRNPPTFPLASASRQKPRKWPLAFRFSKGAIHRVIIIPITLHALFTTLVVYLDQTRGYRMGLPSSIVPSLSIVVGLMLVFRNSSSYERYWGGRTGLQKLVSVVRNLARSFLVCGPSETAADRVETERVVRCLVAILFAVKNYLRGNWGIAGYDPAYADLVPRGLRGHEAEGLGLPFELCFVVERYIRRGVARGDFNAPQSSMLSAQLNSLVSAFGTMETIKLTPIPVCHQIHQKQVLALYCCVLPFCLVNELGWWCIPVIALVCFTLYGIEGIGEELEDPFGYNKNDIRMDDVIDDVKREILVLIDGYKRGNEVYYQEDEPLLG